MPNKRIDKMFEKFYFDENDREDLLWRKYHFLSIELLPFVTYDDDMDIYFGKTIIEVMRVIFEKRSLNYILESMENYTKFLLVANFLYEFRMIDWGIAIRGCWFDYGYDKPIENEEEMRYLLYEFFKEESDVAEEN